MRSLTLLGLLFAVVAAAAEPAPPPLRVIPKAAFTLDDLKAQTPRNKDGSYLFEVPQLANSVFDPDLMSVLAGQSIEATGQLVADPAVNTVGARLLVSRSVFHCCAVHSKPYTVVLEFPAKAPAFKANAWVTFHGSMSYKFEAGKMVPIVQVKEIKDVPEPANPQLR